MKKSKLPVMKWFEDDYKKYLEKLELDKKIIKKKNLKKKIIKKVVSNTRDIKHLTKDQIRKRVKKRDYTVNEWNRYQLYRYVDYTGVLLNLRTGKPY